VYPRTEVQLCIVHLVRASLNYVPWKLRKPAAADLQSIYRAATAAEAEQHLAELEGKWKAYPSVSQVWWRNWARITPFFNYPPGHPSRDLHHQQRGITEPVVAQDHQNPRWIPHRRSGPEVAISRSPAGSEQVDDADSSLARSPEPTSRFSGRNACRPLESCAMTLRNASTSMGRGRDTLPLRPIPKTKPDRLHRRIDTPHLRLAVDRA
jgi:Transposase, Mutator family